MELQDLPPLDVEIKTVFTPLLDSGRATFLAGVHSLYPYTPLFPDSVSRALQR
jgi:hypothetical protein